MRRGAGALASVFRVVGGIIVGIIVIHILLVVLEANPDNSFASFIRDWAYTFSLGLSNLFTPESPKVAVAVNFGIAALIWAVITKVVVDLVRRIR